MSSFGLGSVYLTQRSGIQIGIPITLDNDVPAETGRRMTYTVTEPCIETKDRSCVDVWPVACIHEGPDQLFIDPRECIDCGACEPECPVEAIFTEDAAPQKWESLIPKDHDFFKLD